MNHEYLADVLFLLLAATIFIPLFQRMRLGPVLGYLAAGIVIGPGGLGLVAHLEATRALAELGVVFLLFMIGLEFTTERLRLISPRVYGLGISQVAVTATVIAGVARVLGFDWSTAVIIGGGLSLSSTAIVIPVLTGLGKLNHSIGRTAVAILLIQDLAVGPLLVFLETLSRGGGPLAMGLGLAVIKAAAAIAVILVVGRLVLRPLFRLVAGAKSPEVFVGTALLVVLGTSWATEVAGLSMAFGAFLAGLLLSETEFRHAVAADVEPFRGLLLGLFFMTVGMTVDLHMVVRELGAIAGLTAVLMAGKLVLVAALARIFTLSWPQGLQLGGLLSQGGEFAFILFGAAAAEQIVDDEGARLLTAVVAATMIITPLGVVATSAARGILRRRGIYRAAELTEADFDASGHVVIVGFGEIGRIVARMLKAYGLTYVVLDLSPDTVREARLTGEPVFFGDATRPEVLRGVRVEDALAVVVTTDTPGIAEGLATLRRHTFPDLNILVRGHGEQAVLSLRQVGLTPVGQEATDTGLKLTGAVLDLWHALESKRQPAG
jgi:CPA2 family monovalent cation:H+ antiporter-2